jgi:hypothetical protein
VGQAADLQAGWYVKLAGVGMFGPISEPPYRTGTGWNFTGELGMYGPFEVSSPDPVWAERMVSVPVSVTGVAAGTSVYLWGQPTWAVYYPVDALDFYWETNCDKSVVQLELLMYNPSYGYTKLWSYSQSPYNSGFDNVLTFPQEIPIGYVPVFRVSVVPEPNGVIVLLTGAGAVFGFLRRRQ